MKRPIIIWPRRGDMLGILFAAAVFVIFAIVFFKYADVWQRGGTANGFGPDWDCSTVANSEPVCIKRTPRRKAD